MKLKPNLNKKELNTAMRIAIKEINEWSRFKVQVHKALWKLDKTAIPSSIEKQS